MKTFVRVCPALTFLISLMPDRVRPGLLSTMSMKRLFGRHRLQVDAARGTYTNLLMIGQRDPQNLLIPDARPVEPLLKLIRYPDIPTACVIHDIETKLVTKSLSLETILDFLIDTNCFDLRRDDLLDPILKCACSCLNRIAAAENVRDAVLQGKPKDTVLQMLEEHHLQSGLASDIDNARQITSFETRQASDAAKFQSVRLLDTITVLSYINVQQLESISQLIAMRDHKFTFPKVNPGTYEPVIGLSREVRPVTYDSYNHYRVSGTGAWYDAVDTEDVSDPLPDGNPGEPPED